MKGNRVAQKTPIYLLKMHSDDADSKRKKIKIDISKSKQDEFDSYRPSYVGLFEVLTDELWMV